jgi:hypothetical protein
MSRVLTTGKATAAGNVRPNASLELVLARLAIAAGIAITLVGLTDVGLLWYPPQFGNSEWEFGNLSDTFGSLSLTTIGFALLAAGVITRGSKLALYIMGAVFAFFTLATLGALALFALNLPVALGGTPAGLQTTVKLIMAKNAVLALTYVMLYGYFAVSSFKQAQRLKKP